MTAQTKAKWLRFLVLILGGGTIYKLASLKDAFYVPIQQYMGLSHTQLGTLLSANAIIATALFVVGGYLADRFATRKLIPLGLIGTGSLGLYLATFPGFDKMLIVFCLLAVCADCIYWPALLKAVRNLGEEGEQGRMFGFLEGGRGIVEAALEACRLRLRPIVMTSIAFIAGTVPLVLSHGAGAEVRSVTGITVFAGMLGVTLFGLFLTPVFYVALRKFVSRNGGGKLIQHGEPTIHH